MSNKIRYLCMSDLHLGEEDSLLTNLTLDGARIDPLESGPVLKSLARCVRYLVEEVNGGEKPTLVLAGDSIELALTTIDQALMSFERFVEKMLIENGGLFGRIVYIPGNHDHHLWESARETQYAEYLSRHPGGTLLKIPWHVTSMFKAPSELPKAYLLRRLIRRHPILNEYEINVAYPNFGLLDDGGTKCVLFTHGHYIDSLYHLITKIKTLLFEDRQAPRRIWNIEAENFAWIDFFWSTMGRSGEAGADIERLYEKMHDREAVERVLSTLAGNLARQYDLPGWGDWMEEKFAEKALKFIAGKLLEPERKEIENALSDRGRAGLEAYASGPLKDQIRAERDGNVPPDITLVFGHTHKPFERDIEMTGYDGPVDTYNTGGWTVDTVEREPLHGAAVILVDDELNAASLRMYNQNKDHNRYAVRVGHATHDPEKTNPFYEKLVAAIDPEKEPWSSFSDEAADAVQLRAAHLRKRIKSD